MKIDKKKNIIEIDRNTVDETQWLRKISRPSEENSTTWT